MIKNDGSIDMFTCGLILEKIQDGVLRTADAGRYCSLAGKEVHEIVLFY
jgi:hypothetical protein